MNHVDSKFINLLSPKLDRFKRVKPDLYNFRCPICGDSKKNKSKARGYLYAKKADVNYKCHNCGVSLTFSNLLKNVDPVMHKQYVFERFKDGKTGRATVVEEPKFNFEPPKFKKKLDLPNAMTSPEACGYLMGRRLDPAKFYYIDEFKKWVNSRKEVFENTEHDEPRIIIPLYYQKDLIGIQGRSMDFRNPKSVKYITVMFDDNAPKIFGLDNIKLDEPVYVTEGPFDSTFIRNSVAMCGADADVSNWGISNPIWIYDNEPRNREIVNRIGNTIDRGDSVVIWPSGTEEKDINDMVICGLDVQSVVESNIYSGLEAQLKFNTWKKI